MEKTEIRIAGFGGQGIILSGYIIGKAAAIFDNKFSTLIQSFGMGLVAGVFEEGNMISGIKHVFIMVLIAWVVFKVFVGI